ncbi:MAG TPA: DUF4157 domain-containing protein [Longimicrobiaceae bacterium]|jgi:hypothetical protein
MRAFAERPVDAQRAPPTKSPAPVRTREAQRPGTGWVYHVDRPAGSAPVRMQRKLTVDSPGTAHEQEAEHVAERVTRMPDPPRRRHACSCGGTCPACRAAAEREQVQERLQTLRAGPGDTEPVEAPPLVRQVLSEPGEPLDAESRAYFEPRFGHDFGGVRVHADARAAESARAVSARAYTVGSHVVLGGGEASRGSGDARRLMAHELTHVVQQGGAPAAHADRGSASPAPAAGARVQREPAAKPASEDVWGFKVTRSMCGCQQAIREDIDWAKTASATYAACDVPANPTSTEIEACFQAAHPTATVVAETSSSGTITAPPPSADPCQRIEDRGTMVHETFHARYTENLAKSQGAAFYKEWQRLAGDDKRLETMRAKFPAEVAAFEKTWNNGHEWAQDEMNSYRWERLFYQDVLKALTNIC